METVGWMIAAAPEIFLLLVIAIGTILGRIKISGLAESKTPVLSVAVRYAVGNVVLTVLGPIVVAATHSG